MKRIFLGVAVSALMAVSAPSSAQLLGNVLGGLTKTLQNTINAVAGKGLNVNVATEAQLTAMGVPVAAANAIANFNGDILDINTLLNIPAVNGQAEVIVNALLANGAIVVGPVQAAVNLVGGVVGGLTGPLLATVNGAAGRNLNVNVATAADLLAMGIPVVAANAIANFNGTILDINTLLNIPAVNGQAEAIVNALLGNGAIAVGAAAAAGGAGIGAGAHVGVGGPAGKPDPVPDVTFNGNLTPNQGSQEVTGSAQNPCDITGIVLAMNNAGTAPLNFPFPMDFKLRVNTNTQIKDLSYPGDASSFPPGKFAVPPGETVTFPAEIQFGFKNGAMVRTIDLRWSLDPKQAIDELAEDNNEYRYRLTINQACRGKLDRLRGTGVPLPPFSFKIDGREYP